VSQESCESGLRRAFVGLGLPRRDVKEATRAATFKHGLFVGRKRAPLYRRALALMEYGQCEAIRKDGERCPRAAHPDQTTCGYHDPVALAKRTERIMAVNAAGLNRLRWASREDVAA
jgi:hypothetical protein